MKRNLLNNHWYAFVFLKLLTIKKYQCSYSHWTNSLYSHISITEDFSSIFCLILLNGKNFETQATMGLNNSCCILLCKVNTEYFEWNDGEIECFQDIFEEVTYFPILGKMNKVKMIIHSGQNLLFLRSYVKVYRSYQNVKLE